MKRIALVGEIGSGKTYAAKYFGFPVFNADIAVSNIYKKNKKVFNVLKKQLPSFIKSQPINKKEILRAVLKNKNNLKKITKVIHPLVRKKMNEFLRKNSKKKAVVLDIPLYFENKIYRKSDVVIYIYAKKTEILKKLKKRKSFNFKIYRELKGIQLSNEKKKKKSNFFIKNNFKKEILKKNVSIIKKNIFLLK